MPLQISIPSKKSLKLRALSHKALAHSGLVLASLAIVLAATISEAQNLTAGGPTCKWSDHESRLTIFMARIRTFEKEISDMIETKKKIDNGEQLKLLTQQISFKHKDLAKAVKDYEDERLHLRFQHPDRDMEGDRKYLAQKLKSLDEIERVFGLDGRLDRVRRQVDIVFPTAAAKDTGQLRKPASTVQDDDNDDVPRGIKLVK